jgi:hypothetical protein
MKDVLPRYFSSEWSMAQFTMPPYVSRCRCRRIRCCAPPANLGAVVVRVWRRTRLDHCGVGRRHFLQIPTRRSEWRVSPCGVRVVPQTRRIVVNATFISYPTHTLLLQQPTSLRLTRTFVVVTEFILCLLSDSARLLLLHNTHAKNKQQKICTKIKKTKPCTIEHLLL